MTFSVNEIGTITSRNGDYYIQLKAPYKEGLTGLEGFEYVTVVWWFDGCDNDSCRMNLIEEKPYVHGPETLGTFATRSPRRPNPIAISTAYVTYLNIEEGALGLAWIDARDGSPVLDLKPYTPSADRVETPSVPQWCSHWPRSIEESGTFDWASEFTF